MSTLRFIITTSEGFVNSVVRDSLSLTFIIGDTGSQFRNVMTRGRSTRRPHPVFRIEETARWNGIGTRSNLSGFAVAALLAAALNATADLLADFFDEERGAAGWAGLVDRTIPQGIFAGGILTAGKERTSFSRALLHEVSATAWLGTLHTQRKRLGGFALRIGGAGDELSKPPGFHHHRATALLTLLIRCEFDLRNNLNGAILELLKVLRVLAGGLVLVRGTGEKLAVTPPFNFHHPTALLAGNICRWLHRVLGSRNRLRLFKIRCEGPIKSPHRRHPRLDAFFNFIQLLLHMRGEVDVDQIRESLQQKIVHRPPCFGGSEPSLHLLGIFAILNRRNDTRIGGWSADAFFFQFLDQQGFVIPRWRLGEVLLREHAGDCLSLLGDEPQPLSLAEEGQLALRVVLDFLFALLFLRKKLLVDPLHIDNRMAGELHHGAG